MARLVFQRYRSVFVTCIVLIGVLMPTIAYAKSSAEPHNPPIQSKVTRHSNASTGHISINVTTDADCSSPIVVNVTPFTSGDRVTVTASLVDVNDPSENLETEPLSIFDTGGIFNQSISVDTGSVTYPVFIATANDTLKACVTGADGDESGSLTVTIVPGFCEAGTTLSGASWVNQFPGSNSTSDLKPPFKAHAINFINALRKARAKVNIAATYRPPERAFLMHYAFLIARGDKHGKLDPKNVPTNPGVSICWVHTHADGSFDLTQSRNAAEQMVKAYGMNRLKVPPSLTSRHTSGWAIDMAISWPGTLQINDAHGHTLDISTSPRSGMNPDLWSIGASYNVIKYCYHHCNPNGDIPHWSTDGH